MIFGDLDQRCFDWGVDAIRLWRIVVLAPCPAIPKPQRGQNIQPCRLGPAVPSRYADQDILGTGFRIFHEHVEIPVLAKNPGVEQFIFGFYSRSLRIFAEKLLIWERRVRVLIQELQIRARRSGIKIEVIFLYVFAVVSLRIREAKQALFQDRIVLVPKRESKADVLMAVADSADAILTPAIGARPGMVVWKIVPCVTVCAVIFANCSPLPLGKIRTPASPVDGSLGILSQPIFFVGHSYIPFYMGCEAHRVPRNFHFRARPNHSSFSSSTWQDSSAPRNSVNGEASPILYARRIEYSQRRQF